MAKIDDFGLFLKSASVLRKLLNRSRFETFLSIKNPKFRKFAENGTFVRRLIASNRSIASYRTISRSKALEKWKIYIYGTSLSDKNWRFWSSLNIVSSAAAAPPPALIFQIWTDISTDISTFIFILRGLLNRYGFENFSILFIYISNIGKNHFCKKIFWKKARIKIKIEWLLLLPYILWIYLNSRFIAQRIEQDWRLSIHPMDLLVFTFLRTWNGAKVDKVLKRVFTFLRTRNGANFTRLKLAPFRVRETWIHVFIKISPKKPLTPPNPN